MIDDLKINAACKKLYYDKGWWSKKTICDVWDEQAAACANRVYVEDNTGSCFTYSEIDEKASRLASWMKVNGVEPGDVVSFQVPIWAEFCIVYVACLKAGAVIHPLPIAFNESDLEYSLNLVNTRVFICPTFYHKTDYEAQIESIRSQVPSLCAVALIDKKAPRKGSNPTIAEIEKTYDPINSRPAVSSDDVATILSTSGTTGNPKAVLFTHNNILFSEHSFTNGLKRTREDIMFMPSPLNHATGFYHGLISPMLLGGKTLLQEHFDAAEAIEIMNKKKATWSMGATPFIFDILNELEKSNNSLHTMHLFLCGGAPVPATLIKRAYSHNILLCECYGSTESCPHIFVPPAKCIEWNGAWSGISPHPGIETRVVDEDGHRVALGIQGEESSRGPHQFVGYLNDREATDKALDDEGWFRSGDLCFEDEQGRIRINGRKKEIIIRGGENISANEIDGHLTGCPGVGDHATIGMPDERLGERICTFIVPRKGLRPTLSDVTSYLKKNHVQKRLWPERLEFIDEIPHTATGKVRRHCLAQELSSRMTKDSQNSCDMSVCENSSSASK